MLKDKFREIILFIFLKKKMELLICLIFSSIDLFSEVVFSYKNWKKYFVKKCRLQTKMIIFFESLD